MNDARFQVEDPRFDRSNLPAGDDLLPPVEPPSAGFIIQLFVVPALIVLLIVSLWLAFNWLVRAASRPEDVVKGLEDGPSVARWQRASELADMLRNERFGAFKRDGKSASELAHTLASEIEAAGMDDDDVEFRKYLALALGEFEVQEGMDVLLKAATTNRDAREQKVRDGALQAIAVRAYNLQRLDPPQHIENPDVEPTLLRLAEDEDPLIRFQSAYALGKLGSAAAIERLEVMVDDPDADTRYNAAVALAHRGNAKAVETLAEMLDLDEHAASRPEKDDETAPNMVRSVIVHTAIEAALALAKQNTDADLSPVLDELERLANAEPKALSEAQLPRQAQFDARRALNTLRANNPTGSAL
ncbi:MAG: HEAT repeat domain-containing protein [Planctomycetes bacterium]|nr:HEAT repeat domain-containing protein [Planctomycetota bacterium]